METVASVIRTVDDIKPNAFSDETKVKWLNEVEGLVQTEVFLFAPEAMIEYTWEKDQDTQLLIAFPHDKLYRAYLVAMIDFANGEYDKYANTMQMFNSFMDEFTAWVALNYRPADTHGEVYK